MSESAVYLETSGRRPPHRDCRSTWRDYLLTWNCKHIANAAMRQAIENVCRGAGFEPPVICTPEELMNDEQS